MYTLESNKADKMEEIMKVLEESWNIIEVDLGGWSDRSALKNMGAYNSSSRGSNII